MDDAALVGGVERIGDLRGEASRFLPGQGTAGDPLGEILARHELHHDSRALAGRGNVRTDTVWSTDLSLNYYFPLGFGRKTELFARFVVDNLLSAPARAWRRSPCSRPSP
jgi:hypothetical protein